MDKFISGSSALAQQRLFYRRILSPENPYWKKGGEILFAWNGNEDRSVGFLHPSAGSASSERAVFFGGWESFYKTVGSRSSLQAIEDWARKLKATRLIGPIDFKTIYPYRLRIDSFDNPLFFGEPHNTKEMVDFLIKNEFHISQKYFTDFIDRLNEFRSSAISKLESLTPKNKPWPLHFEPLTPNNWQKYKTQLFHLVCQLFEENPEYIPLSEFDFELQYNDRILEYACKESSFFIRNEQGNLVGFCFNLMEHLEVPTLLVKTIGIDKRYRFSGRTFLECVKRIFLNSYHCQAIAFCLMVEDNLIHRLTRKYFTRRRSYALFEKSL